MDEKIYAYLKNPSDENQSKFYLQSGLCPNNFYVVNKSNIASSKIGLVVPQYDGSIKIVVVSKAVCDFYKQYEDFDLIALDIDTYSKNAEMVQMGL